MLKKHWQSLSLFFFVCTFEVISLFLVSKIFTNSLDLLTLLPIYIVPFILVRLFQLVRGTLPSLYILVPFIQIVLFYLSGYNNFSFIILSAFIIWRWVVHIREPYIDNQGLWLGFVLVSVLPFLLFKREFLVQFVSWFMVLLLLFVMITIMINMKESAYPFMKKGYRILVFYFLGALGIIFILFQSGLALLKGVFPVIGGAVAYVVSYPLIWLISLINTENIYDEIISKLQKKQKKNDLIPYPEFTKNYDDLTLVLIIIGVVLAITLALYFLRKIIGSSVDDTVNVKVLSEHSNEGFSFFQALQNLTPFYSQTGRNNVRIQFYKLQKYLAKRGYGRLPSETAEEWFKRLNLLKNFEKSVLTIYYQSRYSSSEFTDEELATYLNGIKEIKHLLSKKIDKKG